MGLRQEVEAKEGSVEDGIWAYLEKHDWLDTATVEELRRHVRELRQMIRRSGQAPPTQEIFASDSGAQTEISPRAGEHDYEDWRGAPLALYLAKRAAANRRVVAFRADYLEGKVLQAEGAYALLQSPAIQLLDVGDFRVEGIPLLNHSARITVPPKYELAREGDWKQRTLRLTLEINWPGGSKTQPIEKRQRVHQDQDFSSPPWMAVPVDSRNSRRATAFPGSMLNELRQVALEFTDRYPWTEDDTIMFVLTGETPQVHRITVERALSYSESFNDPRLILRIDATLSPRLVEKAYRAARHTALLSDKMRPPSERTLRVVQHVLSSLSDLGQESDWESLMTTWNGSSGMKRRWRFTHPWRMRAVYNRGIALVAYPPLRLGQPPASESEGQHQ